MSLIEIYKTEETGEHCWGVSLTNEEGEVILRSTIPLAKGAALSTAKSLKHKGPDAPLIFKDQEDLDSPAWVAEKAGDSWLIKFTLANQTVFDLGLKPEDGAGDEKIVEKALEVIKNSLRKAEIKWNPPEADPAYGEKESDCTVTQGHPGS